MVRIAGWPQMGSQPWEHTQAMPVCSMTSRSLMEGHIVALSWAPGPRPCCHHPTILAPASAYPAPGTLLPTHPWPRPTSPSEYALPTRVLAGLQRDFVHLLCLGLLEASVGWTGWGAQAVAEMLVATAVSCCYCGGCWEAESGCCAPGGNGTGCTDQGLGCPLRLGQVEQRDLLWVRQNPLVC